MHFLKHHTPLELCLVVLPLWAGCAVRVAAWPMYDGRYYENGLLMPPDRLAPEPPHGDNVLVDYYEQKLDHFDAGDARTFKQKFMVNLRYRYTASGDAPGFLYIGGEGPLNATSIDTQGGVRMMHWMRNARAFGAAAFALEHRYYGDTLPYTNFTIEHLRYLSSRQAIRDAVRFIQFATKQYNVAAHRWIVFGGSYAGNLAAWLREKHSDLVLGAIASSAPLRAHMDFSEYLDVVGDDLKKVNQSCFDMTKSIFDSVTGDLETAVGKMKLRFQVGICPPIKVDTLDSRGLFYDTLMSPFMSIAQYGGDNIVPYMWHSVDELCAAIEDTHDYPDPLDRLVNVLKLLVTGTNETDDCFDVNYNHFLHTLDTIPNNKAWFYQKCTEFGYFKTTNGKRHPFGNGISIEFRIDPCKSLFGIEGKQIAQWIRATNEYYGGKDTFNSSNVVLVNGSQDPWHSLGIYEAKTNRPLYDIAYVDGTAHCADMYPASESDSAQLVAARRLITEKIGLWLTQ